MNEDKNPKWWTPAHDTAWAHVRMAMERDWDQTKHDLGGAPPDTNQNVGNTVRQAVGLEAIPPRSVPAYAALEPAHRFGYGARSNYGSTQTDWDDTLEATLRQDWEGVAPTKQSWADDRDAIRYGWEYHGARDAKAAGQPRD